MTIRALPDAAFARPSTGIPRACPRAECERRQAPRDFTSDVRLPEPLPAR